MNETVEQQAEQIAIAMVKENWNDSVERLANLLRELEAAQKEIANLVAQRNLCLSIARQHSDELEAARKVADAACKWFDICEDEDSDSRVWYRLVDAIREYRKPKEDGSEQG